MSRIRQTFPAAFRWYNQFIKLRQFRRLIASTRPLQVVVGSGGVYEAGWISTDVDMLDLLQLRDWQRWFKPNSIDVIIAEHVWEHLTPGDGAEAAANCYKFLKPGGYLRVAVPDGFFPDADYIEYVKPGGSGCGSDDHKVLYNIESFSQLFEAEGFLVTALEYFDSTGQFHYVDWDPAGGMIHRSRRFDRRNQNGELAYTSIILDARKV